MAKSRFVRNIDGQEIDFEKDDLLEKQTYESANLIRRLCAYAIDVVLMICIWYIFIEFVFNLFGPIDAFVQSFDPSDQNLEDLIQYTQFVELFWRLIFHLFLTWIGVNLVYFTLVPAIIGDGRTVGKMLAGIGVVHLETLEEVSPTRLILREFVGRTLIEHVFIIPTLVSIIFAVVRDDGKMIHDLIAKTVVIKLDLYRLEDV